MASLKVPDSDTSLVRLNDLLLAIAKGLVPDRSEAVLYSSCRSELLASPYRDLLPGYLVQCISVFRFRDFIGLYDPSPAMRQRFVDQSFARAVASFGGGAGDGGGERRPTASLRWEL
jgi:hypothetical protein